MAFQEGNIITVESFLKKSNLIHMVKKTYLALLIVVLIAISGVAYAEEARPEVHIYADGQIHLVYADLYRKHALNQYTVKIWDLKWGVPIDLMDTKIKFESAYGAPVNPSEVVEGHKLAIKGRIVYNRSILKNQKKTILIPYFYI